MFIGCLFTGSAIISFASGFIVFVILLIVGKSAVGGIDGLWKIVELRFWNMIKLSTLLLPVISQD